MLKNKIPIAAAITIALFIMLALAAFTNKNVSTAASNNLDTASSQKSADSIAFKEDEEATVKPGEVVSYAQNTVVEEAEKMQEQVPLDPASIAQNIQHLVAKFAEAKLQPGWLHFTYETRNLSDRPSDPLDNGTSIPSNYMMEEWFHLDADGTAIEVVSSMLSMDGKILQTSVYRDGVWRNLNLGTEDVPDRPVRPALDFAFSNLVKNAPEELTVSQNTTQLNGQDVLLFTVSGSYEEPQKFGSINEPVSGYEKRGYFDPNTGALRLLERVSKLVDRTERIYLQIIPLTVETGVESSAGVDQLLKQWEIIK